MGISPILSKIFYKYFIVPCNKCFPHATDILKADIMKQEQIDKTTPTFTPFNRYAYVAFLVLVIYFAVKGQYGEAFTNLGIALVFDPFDPSVKWQQRPIYQKVWLIIHVTITFAGLIYILFLKH